MHRHESYSALLNASVALQRKPEHIFLDMLPIDDGRNSWYKSFDQKAAVKRQAIAVAWKGTKTVGSQTISCQS